MLRAPVPEPAIERRLDLSVDDDGELLDSASPALLRARREVHAARERLVKKLETLLRHAEGAGATGAAVTMRNGRYVIPVRRDSRGRPDGIVHDESASAGTLFVEPTAAIELGNAFRAALADADREALRVMRDLTDQLRPDVEVIRDAHEMCVALDDLLARARYARSVQAIVPRVREAGLGLDLKGARHPLLLGRGVAGGAVRPVTLGRRAHPADQRTQYRRQDRAPQDGRDWWPRWCKAASRRPLAEGSALPVFERFAADIGDHQSIAADLSTFSAHLATLRGVLEQADGATLILIDEIGSGTDPAEGAALAAAALRELTRRGAAPSPRRTSARSRPSRRRRRAS
jgi:DNA mismatch repair protein MutS2